ncbi:MAG: phosphatidate cytidylyltransferase [Acidobacteriota bacterium]
MKRLLTALVLVPPLIYVIGYTPPLVFGSLVAVTSVICLEEFYALLRHSGISPHRLAGHWFGLLILAAALYRPLDSSLAFYLLCLTAMTLMVLGIAKVGRLQEALASASATLLGLVYVPGLLSFLIIVRSLPLPDLSGSRWIFIFLLMVWLGDTAAYYTGSWLGRHRLAPLISPKKTVEGALGGLVGSIIGAFLGSYWFSPGVSRSHLLSLALVVGIASQIGDLAESALKRGAGVKDSSQLLPGHGGMLDRIDGVLFGAPVLFCYVRLFLVH